MGVELCADCKRPLGTHVQETLPGVQVEKRCIDCETQRRGRWMLDAIPAEDDAEFAELSDWEQEFVASVRQQLERGRKISEKQYLVIERVYGKVN